MWVFSVLEGQKKADAENECAVCMHLISSVLLCLPAQAYTIYLIARTGVWCPLLMTWAPFGLT